MLLSLDSDFLVAEFYTFYSMPILRESESTAPALSCRLNESLARGCIVKLEYDINCLVKSKASL